MSDNLLHLTEAVEAAGHPTQCTEPAPGSVQGTGFTSVTINGDPLAQGGVDTMEFPSHPHQYSDVDDDGSNECHDNQSHSVTVDSSSSITVNGAPVGIIGTKTDPTTGGEITPESTSLTES